MEPGSSIGRVLACLAVTLLISSALVGVAVAAPSSTTDAGLLDLERTDRVGAIDDELNDTTGTLENTTNETTDTIGTVTNETTDALANTTDETTDAVENTTNETTDAVENTTNETTGELNDPVTNTTEDAVTDLSDGLENTTGTTTDLVDDGVELTADLVQYTVDETTGTIEYTVTGTTGLVDDTVAETGTLVILETDDRHAESSASIERPVDESSRENETDSAADGPDDDDRSSPGTSSTAADAVLVGLMGAMTVTGAAAGGGGAGTSAGGAGGSSATTRALRHLRHAKAEFPWKLLPIFKYSRYDDSDPLENDRRRAVYETIEADPGCYLSRISERSDVSLSTVRHHVRILEDEGLVSTAKINGKRRYYVESETSADARRDGDVALHAALDEPAKRDVLEVLADLGRAPNGRLADALDRDPSTVSHHLSSLADDGLVVRERDGRSMVNELAPRVEAALARDEATEGDASSPTPADD